MRWLCHRFSQTSAAAKRPARTADKNLRPASNAPLAVIQRSAATKDLSSMWARPGASPQAPSLAQTFTVTFPQYPFRHPQQFPPPRVLLPYRCSNLVSWALSVKPIPLEVINPHENSVPNCLGGRGSGFPIPAGLPEYPRAGSSSCVHPRSRRLARRPGPSAASPRRHSDSRRRASGHRRNQPRHR